MDVDTPELTAEEALKIIHTEITGLLKTRNVLISPKESQSHSDGHTNLKTGHSMETLADLPLNLDIHRRKDDGAQPELLFSKKILEDEIALGIQMPVNDLNLNELTVLIGVSGCGKTRTCYDLCRRRWGLYFDCTKDTDFIAMISIIGAHAPKRKTEPSQEKFEQESRRLLKCLLTSRLLVLQRLQECSSPTNQLDQFEWFCYQRSRRMQLVFEDVFELVSNLPESISQMLYLKLSKQFRIVDKGIFIFDESQYLLDLLKADYRATATDMCGIKWDGQFVHPRSFFSFLTGFAMSHYLQIILCGTQMRIRNLELIYSAACGKQSEITVFSNFTYLTPDDILALLKKWLIGFDFNDAESLRFLERIAYHLQGRPRHLISVLHRYLDSRDLSEAYQYYVQNMTLKSGPDWSFYSFWKNRLFLDIQPLLKGDKDGRHRRLVSDVLLKLCVSFLFGDREDIPYSTDLDLVSTSLVMVSSKKAGAEWEARMAEPIVLDACINHMVDLDPKYLMKYFTSKLFEPLVVVNPSAQERGHMMEFVIALRFMQGWWSEDEFKRDLPSWFDPSTVPKPDSLLDCRRADPEGKAFLGQLIDGNAPYLLLPHTNAGPDLRYSLFSCCVKTTWTANSRSSMFVSVDDCNGNFKTMKPKNWYSSQESIKEKCGKLIKGRRFIHILFELPDSAPSLRKRVLSLTKREDSIVVVNLNSAFALHFFGKDFVKKYKAFIGSLKKPAQQRSWLARLFPA